MQEQASNRIRNLEEEKNILESRVIKLEGEIKTMELSREALRRDKNTVQALSKPKFDYHFNIFLISLCRSWKDLEEH